MILIKLLLAHLLGDFIFQPNSWVVAKEKKKLASWQLYGHALIHLSLVCLLIWDLKFIKWAFLITTIHLLTDILKLYMQKGRTKRLWFFIDQLIHLSVLCSVWALSQGIPISFDFLNDQYFLLLITSIIILTQPVSIIIRSIISKWTPDSQRNDSLANAGNFIGILERLLVFTFIISNNWEAIGFLLAAKSVFRFGDLKESKDRKLTEYVLIGTFLSFGIAILVGILFLTIISD